MEFMIRELKTLSEDLADLAAIIEEDAREAEMWRQQVREAQEDNKPWPPLRGSPVDMLMRKMAYIGAKFDALVEYMKVPR